MSIEGERPGPLTGISVVELASAAGAFAGKLLADLGADVVLVEPPDGHESRRYEPFVDDVADPDRSLWFWHYNTSKRGEIADLATPEGEATFRRLVAAADVVVEAESPGALSAFSLDHADLRAEHPRLVWVSITPFGRTSSRAAEQATDLTVLAAGGPVWSCGYDDHSLPPVRGGGNQGYQIACVWAVTGVLTALLARDVIGEGQLVDVSMHAAANVTTEAASYEWLVAGATVQRQTARHAAVTPTMSTDAVCADGLQVNTGVPPRSEAEFRGLLGWLDELGGREDFAEFALLELGVERGGVQIHEIYSDLVAREIFAAGRTAVQHVAAKVSAYDFFVGGQRAGLACGVILAPEELFADPHLVEREFTVAVWHEELGREVLYPGAPFRMARSPWRVRGPAPRQSVG